MIRSNVILLHLLGAIGLGLVGCSSGQHPLHSTKVPPAAPRILEVTGRISDPHINESSGLAQSARYEGIFWTLNDSGDVARIFPIREEGTLVQPSDGQPYDGIRVDGATNIDWEAIARVPDERLIIADTGNNANRRHDLTLYLIPEPNPYLARSVSTEQVIPIYFPDQEAFPPAKKNYDCEALFYRDHSLYFVTKHRSDNLAALYRMDWPLRTREAPDERGYPLEKIGVWELRGMVTAADCWQGGPVAVLTYGSVWIFQNQAGDGPLGSPVRWLPIQAGQCETVAFVDGNRFLLGNEQGDLYAVELDAMYPAAVKGTSN